MKRLLLDAGCAAMAGAAAPGAYVGLVGTDLWRLGQAWGDLVARSWVHAVRGSMAAIKTESERRAQR